MGALHITSLILWLFAADFRAPLPTGARSRTMRALLISDIHANIDALEAVLEAAPEHDVVWNLGDVVGYGAAPNEVIERVRGLGKTFVRG